MKILVIADEIAKSLYDYYKPGMLDDIDLILSCGDLSPGYLSFLVTMSHAPVYYVRGNHDHYESEHALGCVCIEDQIINYKGVRILGLGGSMLYTPGSANQYTEGQMKSRIRHLFFKLKRHRGFDILLTHAPAKGLNDMEDLPHQGFSCFLSLMDRYHPKYFIHGHIHSTYGSRFKRLDQYGETRVINAFEKYILEYPEVETRAAYPVLQKGE